MGAREVVDVDEVKNGVRESAIEEVLSDDEKSETAIVLSLSQGRNWDEKEMNIIVGNVMNYILLNNSKRIPVKMSDISKEFINSRASVTCVHDLVYQRRPCRPLAKHDAKSTRLSKWLAD